MLQVNLFWVKPGKEDQLASWLAELNTRSDEVLSTFADETVISEQAFLIPTEDRSILVYAIEATDLEKGGSAYAASGHPIDAEH